MRGKGSQKKLVGQPVFKQLLDFIPWGKFSSLVNKHKSDRYYKRFDSKKQLTLMLFGALSRCDSMSEIVDGMMGLEGKLNHLGLESVPAKSTASDGLRERDNEFFKAVYFMLINHYRSVLSVSRIENVSFSKLFIFDSSTIGLFSDIMKGIGRNPMGDGKRKGGLKVHMLTEGLNMPSFVKISEAREHDNTFLKDLTLPKNSMIVFDRAYNHYQQFDKWTQEEINFVCRLKSNALYEVIDHLYEAEDTEASGVLAAERIRIYFKEENQQKTLCLRKVNYIDDKGRPYEFITNNFEISNEEVALIYKLRWNIELLFKKIKQNFQLRYFYSETANGIKTQVWCTLIAHLLLSVLRITSESKKAFSTITTLVRIHLISLLDAFWIIQNSQRTYAKKLTRNKSPNIQMELF